MFVQIINRPFVVASVFGATALLSGCGESDKHSGNGSSTDTTSSTTTSNGGSSGSATTGSGGTGGENCPPGPPDPVAWSAGASGEGGAGASDSFMCYPGVVCFPPSIEVEGVPFVDFAFANLDSTPEGEPIADNESGVPNVMISTPEPGTVCLEGNDGAGLNLRLLSGTPRDGFNELYKSSDETFHASALGITGLSFTLDNRGEASLTAQVYSFPVACRTVLWSDADQNGNPLVLRESGTTTLTFAEDFWPTFDANELGGLRFDPSEGEYDFCVSDLKFLDEDGDEVVP